MNSQVTQRPSETTELAQSLFETIETLIVTSGCGASVYELLFQQLVAAPTCPLSGRPDAQIRDDSPSLAAERLGALETTMPRAM